MEEEGATTEGGETMDDTAISSLELLAKTPNKIKVWKFIFNTLFMNQMFYSTKWQTLSVHEVKGKPHIFEGYLC